MRKSLMAAAAMFLTLAGGAAAEDLRIGLLTTLSGPGSGLGIDVRDGFKLGLKEKGGKLGGVAVQLFEADDQRNPDVAVKATDEMVSRDKIQIMTGQVWSNLALAIMPTLARSGVFFVSPNAGPSQLAGKQCNPWFFSASYQNDNNHEATGAYVQKKGYKKLYLLAPNYPAGKDALAGFKRFYKGEVAGEVYTSLEQLDFAPELANLRAAAPDAVYAFFPGGQGINFIKQYDQAGLKGNIPLFGPAFSFSQDILPAVGDAALGAFNGSQWSPDLDNAVNRRFVADFRAAYGRLPSIYASQAYDAALILDAAVAAAGSDWADKNKLRAALAAVKIDAARGAFRFNTNHFPIQDYYVREVYKNADGVITNRMVEKIFEQHVDAYVGDCGMK